MHDTPAGQSWQLMTPRATYRHVWERTTPEVPKEYTYSRAPIRSDAQCKTSADPDKAIQYGLRAYKKFVKKQAAAENHQGSPAPCQQPAVPGPQHTQLRHAGTKRPASPQLGSESNAAPSINSDPATPAQQKVSSPWQGGSSSSGQDIPWTMQVTAPEQQQSVPDDTILVTRGRHISTGTSSVVWSAFVSICGKHGLAALKNPTPVLTRLLAKRKCCGKCCKGGQIQQPNSSSGSANFDGAAGGSGEQVTPGCSCNGCRVEVAFKFARSFAQLQTADKKAYRSPKAYVASLQRCFSKEWRIFNACSTCSNVLGGYAVGELRGGSHSRPCMLLELADLGDASVLMGPNSSLAGLRPGSMSLEQAQRIMQQVAVGLAAVHAAPAIYCDLKPANLLLFGDLGAPQVKLADFTTSIFLQDPDAGADGFSTTEGWAPPEAWGDNPQVSSAMDIWSLGMLLLWLRCGNSMLSCTPSQLSGETPCAKIDTLTAIEQNFLECCLCRQPPERWSAAQLLHDHPYFS